MSEEATQSVPAEERVYVDLDTLEYDASDNIDIDPDKDPFEKAPPPPDAWHRAKVTIKEGARGFQSKTTKPKPGSSRPAQAFLSCELNFQIVAPGEYFDNLRPRPKYVNTLVFEGKSEMGAILTAALAGVYGNVDQAKAEVREIKSPTALAKRFAEVLAGEPEVAILTQWQAQYDSGEVKDGRAVYVTAARGQKAFPTDGKGGYKPFITIKRKLDGAQIEAFARAEVLDIKPA